MADGEMDARWNLSDMPEGRITSLCQGLRCHGLTRLLDFIQTVESHLPLIISPHIAMFDIRIVAVLPTFALSNTKKEREDCCFHQLLHHVSDWIQSCIRTDTKCPMSHLPFLPSRSFCFESFPIISLVCDVSAQWRDGLWLRSYEF